MNKKRLIIALSVIAGLIVLAVGTVILLKHVPDPASTDGPGVQLIDRQASELKRLKCMTGTEEYELYWTTDSTVKMTGTAMEIAQSKAIDVQVYMTNLRANRLIGKDIENLAEYGLDTPRAKVSATYTDGSTSTLLIGSLTPNKSGCYIRFEGQNDVYTVLASYAEAFMRASDDYRVMPAIPIDIRNVTAIAVQRKDRERISLAVLSDTLGTAAWELVEPYEHNASIDALEPYVKAILATAPTKFIEEKPQDLAKYGLEKVTEYVTVIGGATGKESSTIFLGDTLPGDSGMRYMMITGENAVYAVSLSSISWLNTELFSLIEQYPAFYKIGYVDKIVIKEAGRTLLYEIKRTAKRDDKGKEIVDSDGNVEYTETFYLDGKLKIEEQARALYANYMKLTVDGDFDTSKRYGDLVLSMEYFFNKEGQDNITVAFHAFNVDYYAVLMNGKPAFYVRKQKVDELLAKNQQYIDGTLPNLKEQTKDSIIE